MNFFKQNYKTETKSIIQEAFTWTSSGLLITIPAFYI